MGEDKVLHTRMNSVSLCVVLSVLAACAAGDDVARKPKLFYVSTSVTTSTLQTASICYVTSGTTITTCTGRKRRSIKIDVAQHAADVKPSQLTRRFSRLKRKLRNTGRAGSSSTGSPPLPSPHQPLTPPQLAYRPLNVLEVIPPSVDSLLC